MDTKLTLFKKVLLGSLRCLPFLVGTTVIAQGTPTLSPQDQALETRVWMSNDDELVTLEKEVVRQIQLRPDSAFYHYLASHLYIRKATQDLGTTRFIQQAAQVANQAMQLAPKGEFGYVAEAEVMELMGQIAQGTALLNQVLAKSEIQSSWRASLILARLRAESERAPPGEILRRLEDLFKDRTVNKEIVVPYLVAVISNTFSNQSAYKLLEDWNKKVPHVYFQLAMADNLTSRKLFAQAHQTYQEVIRAHPEKWEARVNDAVLLYKHLGRLHEAEALLNAAVDKEHMNAEVKSSLHAHLGTIGILERSMDSAGKHFLLYLKHAPNQLGAVEYMVQTYIEKDQLASLAKLLQQVVVEYPGHADYHAFLGRIYGDGLNDSKKAITSFMDAIVLEPDRGEFYTGLGLTFYQSGELEGALSSFRKAITLNPSDSVAVYNEACVLAKMGQGDKALVSLDRAIRLDPTLRQIALEDDDFSAIRGGDRFKEITREKGLTQVNPRKP